VSSERGEVELRETRREEPLTVEEEEGFLEVEEELSEEESSSSSGLFESSTQSESEARRDSLLGMRQWAGEMVKEFETFTFPVKLIVKECEPADKLFR
jgi:hypothetical protein